MLVTTAGYKTRIAQAIAGEVGPFDITPAQFQLGDGRYNASTGVLTDPTELDTDLDNPIAPAAALFDVTRYGSIIVATIRYTGPVGGATITEAGLYTSDNLAIALDSFRPITVAEGVLWEAKYTILPGV